MTDIPIRTLTSKDIFPVSAILRKIGIKELRPVLSSTSIRTLTKGGEESREAAFSLLYDIAAVIVSNLASAEKEIYAFLSSVTSMKEEDLRELPLPDFASLIRRLASREEIKDFFSLLLRSSR